MMAYRNLSRVFTRCIHLHLKQHCALTSSRRDLLSCLANSKLLHTDVSKTSKLTVPGASYDILMQNFRSATDSSDILYNVQQHNDIMNSDHVMQALNSIFTLQKSHNSSMTNGDVVKNKNFTLLCKVLHQKIRFLELNDHLNALKALSFLGVPVTSKISQILLQLIAKQVNMLSLPQIVFVEFIIKDFQQCPLVDALLIALPIVFEARFIQQKCDLDVKQASELFIYAVRRGLSDECIDSFVNFFNEHQEEFDVDICRAIVRSLTETKNASLPYRNLLHVSLDTIIDYIEQLSFNDINSILARLTAGYRHTKHFYHEEFVNRCARYVIEHQCDVEPATLVLRTCNRFVHLHNELIDYLDQKITENPLQLEKWMIGMLLTYIESMSNADYRPAGFESYQDYLIQAIIKLTDKVESPWFRAALNFCSLDCWPKEFFNIIFEEKFLKKFLKRDHNEDAAHVLAVYQAVITLCPSYSGNWPSREMIEDIIYVQKSKRKEVDSPLLGALQSGLSGSSYVCSNLFTKLGHFIDHAVVMRKGGYPVAINVVDGDSSKSLINVEHLQSRIPEDSHIILILYLTPSSYSLNTERLKGLENLKIRVLEAMGYSVLPVLHSTWHNLLDSEKIPYLMQALKNKTDRSEVSQAAVL